MTAVNAGLAYVDGGWALTESGQLRRATSVVDKVHRLLRPLFGAVWCEPHRGNAERPKKMLDAIDTIVADRVRLVLEPLRVSGEVLSLSVVVTATDNAQRRQVSLSFIDGDKRPHQLTEFVQVI
jgi:hypothetical protein